MLSSSVTCGRIGVAAAFAIASGAAADVILMSRTSEAAWFHTENNPFDGVGEWTDYEVFDEAGPWDVTLAHGSTHADTATPGLMGGVFHGQLSGTRNIVTDRRMATMRVEFRVPETTGITLNFKADAYPLASAGPGSVTNNVQLEVYSFNAHESVFELLRDGASESSQGNTAWPIQTWTGVLAAGDYELRVKADGQDHEVEAGSLNGTGYVEFTLTFGGPACAPDFNGDGFLDFFDYDAFVVCFETGACPDGSSADFNGDEFVDFFDYDAFVEAFEAGC